MERFISISSIAIHKKTSVMVLHFIFLVAKGKEGDVCIHKLSQIPLNFQLKLIK